MLTIESYDPEGLYTDEQINEFLTTRDSWSDDDVGRIYNIGQFRRTELKNPENLMMNILRIHRTFMPRIQDMIERKVGPFASHDS